MRHMTYEYEEAEIMSKSWKENASELVIKEKHLCNYMCITLKAMTKHNLKHKNCQTCTVCGERLNSGFSLKNHMESEHSKSADSINLVNEYEEALPSDEQCAEICRMLEAYSSDS